MAKKHIYFEQFPTVSAYVSAMNAREIVADAGNASTARDADEWTGTASYADANALAVYGDEKSASRINADVQTYARATAHADVLRSRRTRAVAGARACVPAAVMNHPHAMYRTTRERVTRPVISVYYCPAANCGVTAESLANAGAAVLSAVRAIEKRGVRVNMYAGICAKNHNNAERVAVFVKVKDSTHALDVTRAAYPLVNPSFLRRHYFRFIETCKQITQTAWNASYGYSVSTRDDREEFENVLNGARFLPTGAHLFTYYDVAGKTPDEIVQIIENGVQ